MGRGAMQPFRPVALLYSRRGSDRATNGLHRVCCPHAACHDDLQLSTKLDGCRHGWYTLAISIKAQREENG